MTEPVGERDAVMDLVGEPVGVVVRLIEDEREPVRDDEGEPAEEELGKDEPEFDGELDGDLDADVESEAAAEPDGEDVAVVVNEIWRVKGDGGMVRRGSCAECRALGESVPWPRRSSKASCVGCGRGKGEKGAGE